jgi:hypothetical protein
VDLKHVLRVMRGYRTLVGFGLILAVGLALLSYARPSFEDGSPTLEPRGTENWLSEGILLISERGFPEGRAVPAYRPSNPRTGTPAVPVGDQGRLSNLAALYSQYASSDVVRRIALRKGALKAEIRTEPVTYTTAQFAYPQVLPLIRVSATAATPQLAKRAVTRIADAFRLYMTERQDRAGIPKGDRVLIDYAKKPNKATLIAGRSMILPAIVFLSVATLAIGLALVLDNIKRSTLRERADVLYGEDVMTRTSRRGPGVEPVDADQTDAEIDLPRMSARERRSGVAAPPQGGEAEGYGPASRTTRRRTLS